VFRNDRLKIYFAIAGGCPSFSVFMEVFFVNQLPIALLKPHPKNKEFFPDALSENLWREMVEDIRENGIINPLIVAPDYTVLAGHLRLEAAKQAGLTHVPVTIRDMDPDSDKAVELLIKDNLLRRQLNDVQVARLIRVLKEQYGIRPGRPDSGNNGTEKQAKIAELIGLKERQVRQLDKLNDLISELQELVSSGKLSSTAAYELAFLSPETQKQLISAYGEKIAGLKQAEAKELRRRIEAEIKVEVEKEMAELQAAMEKLNAEKKQAEVLWEDRERELTKAIADLQEALRESKKHPEIEAMQKELIVMQEKVLEERAKAEREKQNWQLQINSLKEQIAELTSRSPEVKERLVEVVPQKVLNEIQKLRRERDAYRERLQELNQRDEILRETVEGQVKKLEQDAAFFTSRVNTFLKEVSLLAYTARELYRCRPEIQKEYESAVRAVLKWSENTLDTMGNIEKVIDVGVG